MLMYHCRSICCRTVRQRMCDDLVHSITLFCQSLSFSLASAAFFCCWFSELAPVWSTVPGAIVALLGVLIHLPFCTCIPLKKRFLTTEIRKRIRIIRSCHIWVKPMLSILLCKVTRNALIILWNIRHLNCGYRLRSSFQCGKSANVL